ncbi:hypothetical protein OBBRIDRAFT_666347 [Obba rivulosa]|uniref:Zn(2)-C6 fungal-type domain-containing protein n=1 Tax=Obba rivulosa TaxID=1052685 RepID=A0A8E2AZF2_9APHY|nr:hypothetical protein OBBRIDRAFT_666347 [Obba rivulosa]
MWPTTARLDSKKLRLAGSLSWPRKSVLLHFTSSNQSFSAPALILSSMSYQYEYEYGVLVPPERQSEVRPCLKVPVYPACGRCRESKAKCKRESLSGKCRRCTNTNKECIIPPEQWMALRFKMPQACMSCRDSKRSCIYGKLDGRRTKCSACLRLGKPCKYEIKDFSIPQTVRSGQSTDVETVESEDDMLESEEEQ